MSRDLPCKLLNRLVPSLAASALLFAGSAAHADGPHIAFHGNAGAYAVTLFSAPDPLVTGPASFTLLVQNNQDDALDGPAMARISASGVLALAGHPAIRFPLTLGGSGNRDLPGATVTLPEAGDYQLTLQIGAAGLGPQQFNGVLSVSANHSRRNTVLFAVLLPLLLIGLFLVNQAAKQQVRRARLPSHLR